MELDTTSTKRCGVASDQDVDISSCRGSRIPRRHAAVSPAMRVRAQRLAPGAAGESWGSEIRVHARRSLGRSACQRPQQLKGSRRRREGGLAMTDDATNDAAREVARGDGSALANCSRAARSRYCMTQQRSIQRLAIWGRTDAACCEQCSRRASGLATLHPSAGSSSSPRSSSSTPSVMIVDLRRMPP